MGAIRHPVKRSGSNASGGSGSGGGGASSNKGLILKPSGAATTTTTTASGATAASGTATGAVKHTNTTLTAGSSSLFALDPTMLLARGLSSRYLTTTSSTFSLAKGDTCPPLLLTPLTVEEMEKDFRHFNAYRAAVLSYRQQYYVAVNRLHPTTTTTTTTTSSSTTTPTTTTTTSLGNHTHAGPLTELPCVLGMAGGYTRCLSNYIFACREHAQCEEL